MGLSGVSRELTKHDITSSDVFDAPKWARLTDLSKMGNGCGKTRALMAVPPSKGSARSNLIVAVVVVVVVVCFLPVVEVVLFVLMVG